MKTQRSSFQAYSFLFLLLSFLIYLLDYVNMSVHYKELKEPYKMPLEQKRILVRRPRTWQASISSSFRSSYFQEAHSLTKSSKSLEMLSHYKTRVNVWIIFIFHNFIITVVSSVK